VPPGWSDTDIGSPADAGSASYLNSEWTVSGGGADIWGTNDQCNFASQIFNCDGAIVAQINSVEDTDPASGWSKAGVMFRNDNTAGAVNAFMTASATQGVAFQYRNTVEGASSATVISGVPNPVWVKVVRSSDQFSGYYSPDGTNWTQVGTTVTIEMAGPALAGLAVCAHNNAALNTSTFTNVGLSSAAFGIYRERWTNLSSSVGNTLASHGVRNRLSRRPGSYALRAGDRPHRAAVLFGDFPPGVDRGRGPGDGGARACRSDPAS
jgi:hypothetical protein